MYGCCRKVAPALHKRYIASMVDMFGESTLHCISNLDRATVRGTMGIDLENYYSRLGLDIIGKAVFNYDFDSLSKDDAVIAAVYTTLQEAEHRSLCPLPYWKLPFATDLVPRQVRACPDVFCYIPHGTSI
jgi:beta-ring hydroxylase